MPLLLVACGSDAPSATRTARVAAFACMDSLDALWVHARDQNDQLRQGAFTDATDACRAAGAELAADGLDSLGAKLVDAVEATFLRSASKDDLAALRRRVEDET